MINCPHDVLSSVQNPYRKLQKKALTALRLSDEQDESAFLFYSEFNTTTWIKAPPVFNCPNEQGFNCYPWDYSQSSFPSKPTQSSVSLFLRVAPLWWCLGSSWMFLANQFPSSWTSFMMDWFVALFGVLFCRKVQSNIL